MLVQMQREMSTIGAKTDRLISDVESASGKIHALQTSFTWVKGFAAGALLLIPICAAVIWWFVGDKLNEIRLQVMQRPAINSPAPPPKTQ